MPSVRHLLAFAALALGLPAAALGQPLNVGVVGTSSDAPFFIADKKGYFKEAGIEVKFR